MDGCDRLSRNLPSQQLTVQHFERGRVLSTTLLFQGSAHLAMSDAFALRKRDVFIWQEVHWVLMMMMANNHAPLLCLQLLFHCHDLWQTGDSTQVSNNFPVSTPQSQKKHAEMPKCMCIPQWKVCRVELSSHLCPALMKA